MQGDVSRCLCMASEHYLSTAQLQQAKKSIKVQHQETKVQTVQTQPKQLHTHKGFSLLP